MPLRIDPIGTVKKVSKSEALIDVSPSCRRGLDGIAAGDRLDVFYWMHKLPADQRRTLKVHPRGDSQRPLKGVFGLRSPMRPNPVGVSTVTVQRLENGLLYVTPFDAFEGSPIIDIKAATGARAAGRQAGPPDKARSEEAQ